MKNQKNGVTGKNHQRIYILAGIIADIERCIKLISLFKKPILLNDSLKTQLSNNIQIGLVTYEPKVAKNKYFLFIEFNYKNYPNVMQKRTLEYTEEKQALSDKKKLFEF